MQRPCPDAGMLAEPSPFSGSESTAFLDTWPLSLPLSASAPATLPCQGGMRAWRPCVDGPLKESRSNRQLGVAGRRKKEGWGEPGRARHARQLATAASRHMDPEFRLNRSRPERLLACSPKVQNRTSHVDIKTSWARLVALLPTWLRALPKTSATAASTGGQAFSHPVRSLARPSIFRRGRTGDLTAYASGQILTVPASGERSGKWEEWDDDDDDAAWSNSSVTSCTAIAEGNGNDVRMRRQGGPKALIPEDQERGVRSMGWLAMWLSLSLSSYNGPLTNTRLPSPAPSKESRANPLEAVGWPARHVSSESVRKVDSGGLNSWRRFLARRLFCCGTALTATDPDGGWRCGRILKELLNWEGARDCLFFSFADLERALSHGHDVEARLKSAQSTHLPPVALSSLRPRATANLQRYGRCLVPQVQ